MPTSKEPAGLSWIDRFPTSRSPEDCAEPFRSGLKAFRDALAKAGARVNISDTLRSRKRGYLMQCAWDIAKGSVPPDRIPAEEGVDIDWVIRDATGKPNVAESRIVAQTMVDAWRLVTRPSMNSLHFVGKAVDMDIAWNGRLSIADGHGEIRVIGSEPRTGMNPELAAVGATYGVLKFKLPGDPPHWSSTGL
jgi:hypothetical protein